MPGNGTLGVLDSRCHDDDGVLDTDRFLLVVVFGTPLAVFSLVENLLLSIFLALNQAVKNSIWTYFLFLAICDTLVSASYPPIIALNFWSDHTKNMLLNNIWFFIYNPLLMISHTLTYLALFLIMFTAAEKLYSRKLAFQNHRKSMVLAALIISVLSHGSMLFELQAVYNPPCVGSIHEYVLERTKFFHNFGNSIQYYRTISGFLMNVLSMAIVIGTIFGKHRTYDPIALLDVERKIQAQVKIRSQTLLFIATINLICGTLSYIIFAWEKIDTRSLFVEYVRFYGISLELISMLVVFACALRLPIYLLCEPEFRADFLDFLACKRTKATNSERLLNA
ncbi:hypothetical protein L596_012874 [Steinernema carpocapsae]|uniref:G-protein coupled receptors family 1 profile domain-containing protein n=1 Tax=Steinernema carpocapsae TaxID=34508 RepID=A0A4U5NYD6_STECR|nr:hypothetical protein L596_012874 [Steinernema carpocapsae]